VQKEFLTSSEERNEARLKKLQAQNEEYENIINENEELRKNLIKNRTKLSSSSSSSTPKVVTEKKHIGYSYGIGPDEIPGEGEDSVIKVHNWNMFQESLDAVETKKAQLRQENRENRAAKLPIIKDPYASYPAESIKELAHIVGLKIEE
jgi:Asp-tRNA(Asn)/Glu-tRNA(Gln) amidotransferase B subunit